MGLIQYKFCKHKKISYNESYKAYIIIYEFVIDVTYVSKRNNQNRTISMKRGLLKTFQKKSSRTFLLFLKRIHKVKIYFVIFYHILFYISFLCILNTCPINGQSTIHQGAGYDVTIASHYDRLA